MNTKNSPQSDAFSRVSAMLQTDFKVPPSKISSSAHLRHDLAFDSLTLTDLAFIVRSDFGVDAPAEEFRAVDTVGALVTLIEKYG